MNFEVNFCLNLNCKVSLHRKTRQSSNNRVPTLSSVHQTTTAYSNSVQFCKGTLASTSLRFKLSLRKRKRHRRRSMAIAFYVPPEYGPPPPAQAGGGGGGGAAPAQDDEHPQIVDVHEQHFQQDPNNNNINNGGALLQQQQQPDNPSSNDLVGYLWQFVQEILSVVGHRSIHRANQASDDGNAQIAPAARDNRDRVARGRVSAQIAQDNQNNAPENQGQVLENEQNHPPSPPRASPPPSLLPFPLPDIVTCHAGVSFRYGSSHPNNNNDHSSITSNANQDDDDRELAQSYHTSPFDHPGPLPLSPRSSHFPSTSSSSMDFEVNFKFEVSVGLDSLNKPFSSSSDPVVQVPAEDVIMNLSPSEQYRLAGRQLREIADNFSLKQRTRVRRTRRRSPSSAHQSTFEFDVVISVAIPAVALVGLGLAYLRRK